MQFLSANIFRSLFERSPLAAAVVNALGGRVIEANARFAALLGRSVADLAGFDWLRLLHHDDLAEQRERLAQLAAGTIDGFQIDTRYLRADGVSANWRLSVSVIGEVGVEAGVEAGDEAADQCDDGLRLLILVDDVTERLQQVDARSTAVDLSEHRLGALIEQGLAGTAESDLGGRLIYANDRYCQIVGRSLEEILGRPLSDFTPAEDWLREKLLFERLLSGEQSAGILAKRYVRRDGSFRYTLAAIVLMRDATGAPTGYVALVTDTSELKQTEHELRDSEQRYRALSAELEVKVRKRTSELVATQERIVDAMARVSRSEMKFRAVFEQSPLGIALVDPFGGRVFEANQRFAAIFGYDPAGLDKLDWSRFLRPSELPVQFDFTMPTNGREIESFQVDKRYLRFDGNESWLRVTLAPLDIELEGHRCHLALVEDITQQKRRERELDQARSAIIDANLALQAANAELNQLATTDPLTGAWNRRHFQRTVAAEIKLALRYEQPLSLLLFDIDHFKSINDRHGHQVGDQVLIALTHLVQRNLRASDVLARWGGEEFAVVLPLCSLTEAAGLAEKIRALIAGWDFPEVGTVTVSCGLAEFRPDESLDAWLKRVDDALYAAKSAGRNVLRQAA